MFTNTKLNQILAIERSVKTDTEQGFTALYQRLAKAPLLSGITRTYERIDDADVDLPGEQTLVQVKVDDALASAAALLTRLFNVSAARDYTNCVATGDITVNNVLLLAKVPVTYLLFLEKQLVNVETFIRKLPTLDPSETWSRDQATDVWRTEATRTTRTKKIPRNHVKAVATDKHPAQVEVFFEDTVVGFWKTVKFSGALPAQRVNELLVRVRTLAEAVKFAREQANVTPLEDRMPGKVIFDYLFA